MWPKLKSISGEKGTFIIALNHDLRRAPTSNFIDIDNKLQWQKMLPFKYPNKDNGQNIRITFTHLRKPRPTSEILKEVSQYIIQDQVC